MRADTTRGSRLYRLLAILASAAAAAVFAGAIAAQQAPATQSPALKAAPAQKAHVESDGERVFATNCSRCHTAPDGFSQRISGTVVRHMRVRASLSEQDEKALLRFFNPQ